MKYLKIIGYFLCSIYLGHLPCLAQNDTLPRVMKNDTSISKIGVLPAAFYAPETRFGFGGFVYAYFKASKATVACKKSNAQSYFSYTINKQFSIENDYQIWLKRNKFYFTGGLDYQRYPEYFYGISNNSKEHDKIMISFDLFKIRSKNLIQIKKYFYAGIFYQFEKLYNLNMKLKEPMAQLCELIPGGNGYSASGIGPILIYDQRDNPLNPAKGGYFETSFQYFDKSIGSGYNFKSFIFDARKYNVLFEKVIWNGNLYAHLNNGQVPYRMLATIGGARFLRGYYKGRFRGNNMVILQQELRMPIYKWFGIAAFGGLGSVAKQVKEFSKNEIHHNFGVGLRLRINKKENTNIRLDYGVTKDSQGLYFIFAEAF
ncbi:MAG: BamA/TamA family outer membrane protein [bacterium]|nr:BamA/TamA family outer membrane protein [bacterium]